jgi:dTDP-4-amino-4,6-dideoxygalactose transaminase
VKKISFLDLGAQQKKIKKKLTHNVNNVLKNSNYIMGREVKELEGQLQNYTKAKFCISCSSGTDALILALLALNIGRGDKVICPSFTFPATAEAILITGAEPLFIDVSKDTFNICYLELEKALEENNNKIKAIISVDLFGLPANYKKLKKIARRYNVHIISDAAQSFGASFYDKKVGAISDITCTSFFPAKPLGCYGDGGAVFTKSKKMKNKLESLRAHGKGKTKYKITDIGLNSRLDTIQAAVLLAKMDVFDWELNKRNDIASQYTNELKNYFDVPIIPKNTVSAWAQYTLKSNNRKKTLIFLKEKAIPTMIYYPIPMHMQPAYSIYNNKKFKLTNSISLAKTVFSIPIHPYLSNSQKEYIIESLKESTKYG